MGASRSWHVGLVWGLQAAALGCGSHDRPPYIDESSRPADDSEDSEGGAGAPTTSGSNKPKPGATGSVSGTGCTAALPTGFCFVSQKNDFVGGGSHVSIDGAVGQIVVQEGAVLSASAEQAGQSDWWADFSAADGQYFLPGSYAAAQRYPFNEYGAPALSIFGDGRGCNELTGSFVVTEMERDPFGNFTRFAATFEQHCEGAVAALFGAFNYNANGAPDEAAENPAACQVALPRGFCFSSQMGHGDGGGRFVSVTDEDTDIRLFSRFDAAINLTVDNMSLTFGGPGGARLAKGVYEDAVESSPSAPILNTGCSRSQGRFEVLALEYVAGTVKETPDESSKIAHFDVDYEYTCGDEKPELHGKLRYTAP